MEKLDTSSYLQNLTVAAPDDTHKFLNTRSVALKPFVDRIDGDRQRSGRKPYGPAEIARCMSHIATDDLTLFYDTLSKAKSFGSLWHWFCKPKKGEAVKVF